MAQVFSLPVELLEYILLHLDNDDLKGFRCVSHECKALATPHVFDEVLFDLELGGCDSLAAIVHHPELQRNVRTVRLKRRHGLRDFPGFTQWCSATVYEHVPWPREDGEEHIHPRSQSMSQNEWEALSEDDRELFYEEYRNDEQELEEYTARLAMAASPLKSGGNQNLESDAQQTLLKFRTAINALTRVSAFAYTPAYEDEDNWGRTWRRIEFHPEGLVAHCSYGFDPDIDALQLFIALQITLLAPNSLDSVELFTRGHAFWSSSHLRRLFDWSDRLAVRFSASFNSVKSGLDSWSDDIGGTLAVIQHSEALTRHIVGWERSFSRVTRLECRIDTGWSDDPDEFDTIARSLSHVLKETKNLEHLDLVFRKDANVDSPLAYTYHNDARRVRYPSQSRVNDMVKVSTHLLLTSAPSFLRLQYLHLSLATGTRHLLPLFARLDALRHLRLDYVALLPGGGVWDTVLQYIAQHLRLHRIELRALEDIHEQKPRLLLDPQAPEWVGNPANTDLYIAYEDAIVRFTLRLVHTCPPLSPGQYLEQYSKSTKT